MEKYQYLMTCLKKRLLGMGLACPSCGSKDTKRIARKYVVTELVRCQACDLMFRIPTTSSVENEAFYQHAYSQGFTSDMPDDESLSRLVSSSFAGSEKDYSIYLQVLDALGGRSGMRLFDFGCSWGYGSWQLARAGYDVIAYEISKPRGDYARRKLGITVCGELSEIAEGRFDIFFSAHVLEHVPSVQEAFSLARKLLKPNGLMVSFTPNGSQAFRQKNSWQWQRLWGMVHPNFLDDQFYSVQLPAVLLASDPYDLQNIRNWAATGRLSSPHSLEGIELLAAARLTLG